ncbi:MAG TPA: LysM peptidoglycan-binding domain-containing protein [Chlamydiales bacterium]|jgi:LysM repeat protein|nr:LysM peptidoglycan-binding domain-containing protein [Chlamydiales bacterium]
MDQNLVKKFRMLNISLVISGALNIGFIAAFVSNSLQDRASLGFSDSKKTISLEEKKLSNSAELFAMSKLTFRELVTLLTNRDLVEEGYSKRDLALSALVAFHHFNLEKALGASIPQKREISWENESIALYPGLSEEAFAAVIRFAYEEKWPLTSKGLFFLLQKNIKEESLERAFMITPEFYAVQLLFQKTEAAQDSSTLLSLTLEGSWELLEQFAKEQQQLLDFSVEKRRRLLLSYLAHKSKVAAELLLKTDFAFSQKRLDDRGILDLLSLLTQRTEESEAFCLALAASPRSDAIRKASHDKMLLLTGAPPAVSEVNPLPVLAQPRYHTVGPGESLWKIAREYKVKVDDIVLLNGIDKDKLYPGMTLKIPD